MNLPFESSMRISPLWRTWPHARLSISATVFLLYVSAASMLFHSSLVTLSASRPSALPEKPSASSSSSSSFLGSAGGAATLAAFSALMDQACS